MIAADVEYWAGVGRIRGSREFCTNENIRRGRGGSVLVRVGQGDPRVVELRAERRRMNRTFDGDCFMCPLPLIDVNLYDAEARTKEARHPTLD